MEDIANIATGIDNTYKGDLRLRCLSCKSPERVAGERGGLFCRTCIERSRMKNLHPLLDDLGGAG